MICVVEDPRDVIGYVTELLGKFRELGIDFNTTQTIFLGGGSILMAEFIQIVWKRYGGEYSVIGARI